VRRREQALTTTGHIAAIRGDMRRCDAINREVYASASTREDRQMQASALVWMAAAQAILGDAEEAASLLEQALPLFENNLDAGTQIIGYGTQAVTRVRLGQPDAALAACDSALNLLRQHAPTSFSALPALAGIAGVYLRLWQLAGDDASPELRHSTEQSLDVLVAYARTFPIGWPFVRVLGGLYHHLAGNPRRAFRWWRRGEAQAGAYDMPFMRGRARLAMGHYGHDPAQKRRYLMAAKVDFESIDASIDLERVEHALAQLD
jgi:tetratricopeptide (TPR) repeat protein